MTHHFYIHIPFCKQKCPYCKFALTPVFDEFKKKRYIEYLKKEIKEYFQWWKKINEDPETGSGWQKTIYFWGWTPSILTPLEIREILECFPFYGKIKTEITLESNPEDITEEYISSILKLWINRISIGVQTLNEKSLTEIHRSNPESILSALNSINTDQISLNTDFILGLPYTKTWEILEAIKKLHNTFPNITHTSVYMLENELYPKNWKANSISEDELKDEFLEIIEYFESIGWNHYEFSNWAKPGYESIHNRAYWNHSNSRGFGLSGASYEDGKRWNNSSSFDGYYKGKIETEEHLTNEQLEIENMMFWLRTDGWIINTQSITPNQKIQTLINDGFIEMSNNKLKLTKTWIFMIDHIMSELV